MRKMQFIYFKDFLLKGDFYGVLNNFAPEYLDIIVDNESNWRPIHYASWNGNIDIVKLLIEHKCDIESETSEKWRPIHYASFRGHADVVKLLTENCCNIEIKTMLSKRPIHFACGNGHTKVLKILIEQSCNIESETDDNKRPIHFACLNGHIDITKLLIEQQCQIGIRDKNGQTPLDYAKSKGHSEIVNLLELVDVKEQNWRPIHYACWNGNIDLVKLLIENKYDIETETSEKWRPIHFASSRGHADIVKVLIRERCNIEIKTILSERPIHFASINGHTEIVKMLIEQSCNIESETDDNKRPIHFACLNGHIDITKLLIEQQCQIGIRDKNGQTPLDYAKSKGHSEIVNLLELVDVKEQIRDSILNNNENSFEKLYTNGVLTATDNSSGYSWLEMALHHKADKIITFILDKPIDDSEIRYIKNAIEIDPESINTKLWQEILLYRSIKNHHEEGFQLTCHASVVNCNRKIVPFSFLEVAVKYKCFVLVQEILRKSLFDTETWNRAKTMALDNACYEIFELIYMRESLLTYRQRAQLSILHTAVCDNDSDMAEYILKENLVDPNYSHENFGTALALAIGLCHEKCLNVFDRFYVDCNTQNRYSQTPLHEAISNGMIKQCAFLIDRIENIDEAGFMGQTALHCAVMRGCEELCDQLMKMGADCSRYLENFENVPHEKGFMKPKIYKRENCLTLCAKMNETIYPCFFKELDYINANSSDIEENSLLHLTAKLLNAELCNTLIRAGGDVNSVNKSGRTPILELLNSLSQKAFDENSEKIIDMVVLFVQSGFDINRHSQGDSSFHIAYKLNNERLLIALLPPEPYQLFDVDEIIFKTAVDKKFYHFCEILLERSCENHLKRCITKNIIDMAVQHDHPSLLKHLFIEANENLKQLVIENVLYRLVELGDYESFESLLDVEIKNLDYLENGETLLTCFLKEQKFNVCEKIIQSNVNNKKYINYKNRKKQTPLQVAIEVEWIEMVQHLIFDTVSLNNEDCEGRTALSQLFVKISKNTDKNRHFTFLNAIKAIISAGGNIYYKTSKRKKNIHYCSLSEIRKEIEMLVKNKKYSKSVKEIIVERERDLMVKEIENKKRLCGICLDNEVDSVFECGHTTCERCGDKLFRCPFCNFEPAQAKRIYFN